MYMYMGTYTYNYVTLIKKKKKNNLLILNGIVGFNRAQVIGAIVTPHSIHLTPQRGDSDPSPTTGHPSNKGPGVGVGVVPLTGVQGRTVIKPS